MIKKKNIVLIISVIFALAWLVFSIATYIDTGKSISSTDDSESIGLAVGMALVLSHLIVGAIGALLHIIGGFTYVRGLVLADLIVECVSILLMFTWGFGYIAAIVFGFIGFAKMGR